MSKDAFQIVYDGPAVESGAMDVRDLAPALLAISELAQHSNRILNGERAQVQVKIRSEIRRGSFTVSLEVIQQLAEHAKAFLLGDDVKAARTLLELLFGSVGLAKLIKFLRGGKATKVAPTSNQMVRVEINNAHIEVHPDTIRLYNDSSVREAVYGTVKPLESEGIERLEVKRQQKVIESVTKEEVGYFAPAPFEEPIHQEERIAAFEVVTLSFEDRYKWRFTDGNATFTAAITDERFFERVQTRQVAFGKGDVLRVKLHTKTWRTDKGLKTDHNIVEVLEIIPAARQTGLLPLPEKPEHN